MKTKLLKMKIAVPSVISKFTALWNVPLNEYRIRWVQTSDSELETCENKILSFLKNPFKQYFVDISDESNNMKKKFFCNQIQKKEIWTLEMDSIAANPKTPIVLIHGFAAGTAFWALNLDELAKTRKVYAIDLLGFGRSSRPDFNLSPTPEEEIIDSLENWRKNVNLNNKFILLGHSFGAYIAMSYAIKHPDHIKTLVLADPWGLSKKSVDEKIIQRIPLFVKALVKVSLYFNPLAIIRLSGPFGPRLMSIRDDLRKKFVPLMGEEDSSYILKYAYHCNAAKPSGETVFREICDTNITAKHPLLERANELNKNIALHFIYACQSWLYSEKYETLKELFPENKLDVTFLSNSGHHLYSDNPDGFNALINEMN